MLIKRWRQDVMTGGLGITPSLDTIVILIMCWILAPIDVVLTWIRLYKEAEEARRNNTKIL